MSLESQTRSRDHIAKTESEKIICGRIRSKDRFAAVKSQNIIVTELLDPYNTALLTDSLSVIISTRLYTYVLLVINLCNFITGVMIMYSASSTTVSLEAISH